MSKISKKSRHLHTQVLLQKRT